MEHRAAKTVVQIDKVRPAKPRQQNVSGSAYDRWRKYRFYQMRWLIPVAWPLYAAIFAGYSAENPNRFWIFALVSCAVIAGLYAWMAAAETSAIKVIIDPLRALRDGKTWRFAYDVGEGEWFLLPGKPK